MIEPAVATREEIVYGKFRRTTVGNDKPSMTTLAIYADQSVSLSYSPDKIEVNGRKYLFHFPLRCLLEKEDETYLVKSEMLDLIGTGGTEVEAKESFDREFDFIYHRYNELDDARLSPRLRRIKTMLNQIVKSVA